jgi:(p)ppGpp synthase/HD superfamily hydrolase
MKNFKRKFLIIVCLAVFLQRSACESHPISNDCYQTEQGIEKDIQQCRNELEEYFLAYPSVQQMFDETVFQWHRYFIENEGNFSLKTLLNAISFAKHKHQGQSRKDAPATPYIIHPIGVARLLWEVGGIRDEQVLIAALLHDTLEDTNTTPEEIENFYGKRVRLTVEELTNDPHLSIEENKKRQVEKAPHLSIDAKVIKLADRLYNVRDLRIATPNWTKAKLRSYVEWAQKLLDALRGINQGLEHALEEEMQKHDSLAFDV